MSKSKRRKFYTDDEYFDEELRSNKNRFKERRDQRKIATANKTKILDTNLNPYDDE